MVLITFAKECHPRASVLSDVLFVSVILSLASRQDPRFCPAPVGRGLRSLRASPFGEEGSKREKLLYRTIKYDKMGWVV